MAKSPKSLWDRWSWLVYLLVAVVFGGLLGRLAGRHPRGIDPLLVISKRGSAILVDAFLVIIAFVAVVNALMFLLGLVGGDGGIRSRLANGFGVAVYLGTVVLVFLGGGFTLCLALVVLSLWAGLGAGPLLGALAGSLSVALAIGSGLLLLRSLGRVLTRKKLALLENIEDTSDTGGM